ncbi:MAG TPA: transglycosylase domain-containing protein, partial [Anaerolineales bacterium]
MTQFSNEPSGEEPPRRFRRLLSEIEEENKALGIELPEPGLEDLPGDTAVPSLAGDSLAAGDDSPAAIPADAGTASQDGLPAGEPLAAAVPVPQRGETPLDDLPAQDPPVAGPQPEAAGLTGAEQSDSVVPGQPASETPPMPADFKPASDETPTDPAPSAAGDPAASQQPARKLGDTAPLKPLQRPQPSRPASPSNIDGQTPPRGTPLRPPPALDEHGFPLPRRVNEIDLDGTRVTPAAYNVQARPNRPASTSTSRPQAGPRPQSGLRRPASPPVVPPAGGARRARPAARPRDYRKGMGCLLRSVLISVFGVAILALFAASILLFQYYSIARSLPDIRDLRQKASQFETTRILDRNGNTLYEILDPSAGRRTNVPLKKISPFLVAATIATEDKDFYSHPGFDIAAIVRAFWQNYQSGETVSGASTITQQLARALLFTPQERNDQSYNRKIREAILASEITRRYSKDEILELYLNEIYYGNLAYGVEAASETYFGATSDKLTLGQAAFLAGLPQSPSVYDVYTNRDATMKRQESVLVLMYEASQQQGCIYVSNNPQRICLDPVAITNAASELKSYQFQSPNVQMRYPHWVTYIKQLLASQYDDQTIYRAGFTVYTTIDPGLQDLAQKIVKEQVDSLVDQHATDGALVALRPGTGEILAMVGSADFNNKAISGEVNMATSPTRQPGSSIKPLTYVAAFEKGWTPGTLIWDVPSQFPPSGRTDDTRDPYQPVNYDGRFHGPVTVRTALANSYNIPAVKTLDFVGIYEDPAKPGQGGFLAFAKKLGSTSFCHRSSSFGRGGWSEAKISLRCLGHH